MALIVRPAPPCLAVDTVEPISQAEVAALKAYGVKAVFRYLQNLSAGELAMLTRAGLGVGLVGESRGPGWVPSATTGAQDAASHLALAKALGVPAGMVIFDDVEGPSTAAGEGPLLAHVDTYGAALKSGEKIAGVYVGDSCGLTSEEWQARPDVHRYWASCSRILDRFGKAVWPSRGWSVFQMRPPNYRIGGREYDLDALTQDYFGSSTTLLYDSAVLLGLGDTEPPPTDPDATLDPAVAT